jgi:hypothetical protein
MAYIFWYKIAYLLIGLAIIYLGYMYYQSDRFVIE